AGALAAVALDVDEQAAPGGLGGLVVEEGIEGEKPAGPLGHVLQEELDLEKIVVNKVSKLSSDKLEDLLYQIMSREFRFVELIGAVLGFLIGLIQVGITLLAT
ncbi:MAG: DUF445 family protein, partial [Sphingobacteriales bacterium]